MPSRRTVVIERGVLKSYLLNSYAARKLGMKTTGNASRGLTGNAGIGHGNFFIEKGTVTPEQIIGGIRNGFYVTELMGFGVNIVTGDYSRGAAGLLDSRRRAGVRGLRSDHRGQSEGDAAGLGSGRQRPGIPRLRGGAHAENRGNDRWRKINSRSTRRRS